MNPRRSLNFQRSIHSQQPYCTRKTEKLSHVERSSSNYPDIAVEETNCPLISNFSPPSIHPPPLEWLLLTNAATDHLTNRLSLFFRFLPRTNPFLPRRVHHHQSSPVRDYPSKSIFSPTVLITPPSILRIRGNNKGRRGIDPPSYNRVIFRQGWEFYLLCYNSARILFEIS